MSHWWLSQDSIYLCYYDKKSKKWLVSCVNFLFVCESFFTLLPRFTWSAEYFPCVINILTWLFLFLTFHNYPGLLVFEPSKKASPLSSLWCMEPMIICWKCKESPWTPYTFVTIGTLVRSWYRASISPLLCGRRDKGENSPPFKSADPLLCLSEKPLQPLRFLDDMLSYTFYR